jgi:hypothetical protein
MQRCRSFKGFKMDNRHIEMDNFSTGNVYGTIPEMIVNSTCYLLPADYCLIISANIFSKFSGIDIVVIHNWAIAFFDSSPTYELSSQFRLGSF